MIEWINRVVFGGIGDLMRSARTNYGVDPVAFLIIYLGSVPFFYYSIFRMVRAMARRKKNEITFWSTMFLVASVAPFLYVLFFGHNLPWWAYGFIGLLVGQGTYSLMRKLTKRTGETGPAQALPPLVESMTMDSMDTAGESPISAASRTLQ
jgi:fatty acid desaturase